MLVDLEDLETERNYELMDCASQMELTSNELEYLYSPGTINCHEAFHTLTILEKMVREELTQHPAVLTNPKWYCMARSIEESLRNLLFVVGESHFSE